MSGNVKNLCTRDLEPQTLPELHISYMAFLYQIQRPEFFIFENFVFFSTFSWFLGGAQGIFSGRPRNIATFRAFPPAKSNEKVEKKTKFSKIKNSGLWIWYRNALYEIWSSGSVWSSRSRVHKFLTCSNFDWRVYCVPVTPDSFVSISIDFYDKFLRFSGFVGIFNKLVLEAQKELSKKLGHYEYLLLEKRSFPGSFVF